VHLTQGAVKSLACAKIVKYSSNVLPQHVSSSPLAMIDTGATGHYLRFSHPLSWITAINKGSGFKLPDGSFMTSTHNVYLPINGIPKAAFVVHILPCLKYGPYFLLDNSANTAVNAAVKPLLQNTQCVSQPMETQY
jgi:hypothetical protein